MTYLREKISWDDLCILCDFMSQERNGNVPTSRDPVRNSFVMVSQDL